MPGAMPGIFAADSNAIGFCGSLLAKAAMNVDDEGVFPGLTADAEIGTIGIRKP